MPELRSCRVSYQDSDGIKQSVEVRAETLYEAAVLGMTTLRVTGWTDAPNLTIEVTVKAPETTHSISSGVLAAWLSRSGKSPREQALKSRLLELMHKGSPGGETIESGAENFAETMIRFGTAGWQYRDWEGIVYPKPRPRGFDPLSYLAGSFDLVEINSSFYGPPQPDASRAWVARVGDQPHFRFTAKLWKGFTHERNATASDEKLFKEGIQPLADAGRLGALLIQFPWSFKNEPENRNYIWRLQARFANYPLVLEVRHSSWIEPQVLDTLAELGVGLWNIDQPLFHRSVKPAAHSTSGIGYVRLHGRNYKEWFSPKADVRARYDFLYTVDQLEPWVDRIRKISAETRDTYVVTNNHNLGKATVNAFELQALFGKRINPPAQLVQAYPELEQLALNSGSG